MLRRQFSKQNKSEQEFDVEYEKEAKGHVLDSKKNLH